MASSKLSKCKRRELAHAHTSERHLAWMVLPIGTSSVRHEGMGCAGVVHRFLVRVVLA